MKKLKEIWKDHKKDILIIAGGTLLGTGIVLGGKYLIDHGYCVNMAGKDVISWTPNPNAGSMNLERVKEILDLNADNASQYAIFREGPNPNEYVCIILSEGFKAVL